MSLFLHSAFAITCEEAATEVIEDTKKEFDLKPDQNVEPAKLLLFLMKLHLNLNHKPETKAMSEHPLIGKVTFNGIRALVDAELTKGHPITYSTVFLFLPQIQMYCNPNFKI